MARIAEEEIERIKRETNLVALVGRRGIELRRHGKDLLGLCPFHHDREPSLVVTPEKNLWNCLGACGEGGDVIRWVMKSEGVSFRHAIELLREGLGAIPERSAEETVKVSTVRHLPSPVDAEADHEATLRQVADYYHETLLASEPALAYLEKRGIRDDDAIAKFRLGYADRSLGLRIPAKNRKEGEAIRTRLQELGVIRSSGHEHLSGSLVVPIFDREGNVSGMYGRKINDNLRAGTPLHLYLPGPHRGIWNVDAFAESKEIILCESAIDALTFWRNGFHNVTWSYGINGFTDEMFEALRACRIGRVLIAYDRDDAGDEAAAKLAQRLGSEGIGAFRVLLPRGMDANEYALKMTPAAEALRLAIGSAEWMSGPTRAASDERRPPSQSFGGSGATSEEPESASSLRLRSGHALAAGPSAEEEQLKREESVDAEDSHSPLIAHRSSLDPIEITIGDRSYRIRGLDKNLSYEQLKIVLRVATGEAFFMDTVDLVSARHRAQFIKAAAIELGVKEEIVKKDLAKVHFELEAVQEEIIRKTLEPRDARLVVSAEDEREAMRLLRDPKLVERILEDFTRCGVVGEETNKLMGYLAAVSRKLDEPLAILVQSSSAAGKSALMEAVIALMPDEERVQYSAMTGQSLFYMGETDLKHKILAIAEEEGAERASYALKLLQSEGVLTIASTGKDPHTGRLVTHEYRVEGPVMIFLTTTAIEIDEELLNRCIVLTVDENREQTRAIHRLQREAKTLEGLLAKHDRERILALHRNAQRLLRPVLVANPFARRLTFLDGRTRTRRDHVKYLTLIQAIALLHQHQRERKRVMHRGHELDYIEVTLHDIALANRLAHEVLGRSLDELAPQTRRLLDRIEALVDAECAEREIERSDVRFTQKSVRDATGWSDFQVKSHIRKLVELEYLLVHRGGRGQSFVYELVYDGQGKDGSPFLTGLIDVDALKHDYDSNREHRNPDREQPGSIQGAPGEHGGSTPGESLNPSVEAPLAFPKPQRQETAHQGLKRKTPIVRTARSRKGNGRAEP